MKIPPPSNNDSFRLGEMPAPGVPQAVLNIAEAGPGAFLSEEERAAITAEVNRLVALIQDPADQQPNQG